MHNNRMESFKVVNGGRTLVGKPFVVSNELFYVAIEQDGDCKYTDVNLLVRNPINKAKLYITNHCSSFFIDCAHNRLLHDGFISQYIATNFGKH